MVQTQKLDIFDADGTLVDPSGNSLKEREYIVRSLNPRLSIEEKETLLKEAERRTLENPFTFPWLWQGKAAAFTEDSWTWRRAQLDFLRPSLKDGTDIAASIQEMFSYATQKETLEIVPNAKELVARLLRDEHAVVIITSSFALFLI